MSQNIFPSEPSLTSLVSEAKHILTNNKDLNSQKENLSQIIAQVDFLLGKYDNIYEKFIDIFISMGQFDFSKRLAYCDNGDNFINFITNGINILNEEYEEKAISKKVFHDFVKYLTLENTIVAITRADGFIYFANSGNTRLENFDDASLLNQSIHILFTDFDKIEKIIQNEGSCKNIETQLQWKKEKIPAKLDIVISNTSGKIESLLYIVKI